MRLLNCVPMRCTRTCFAVLVLTGAFLAGGCRPAPTITVGTEKTSVHTPDESVEPDEPEPASNGDRILGAYIIGPVSEGTQRWWVFKMRGGPNTIGKREADFDSFLASLRMPATDGALPAWKLPEHWRVAPKKDAISILNIRTGHQLTPVDITMSVVGGSLLENINRWQDQVGATRTDEAGLSKLWRETKTADGKTVYRLDLKGPGGKKNAMMPPFAKS